MNKEDLDYLTKYIERNYEDIVREYEEENSDDHIQMFFEEYPLTHDNVDSIVGLFNEYLINLHIIRNYKGSKLTKKDLDYLEQLIRMGMIFIFQFSNKDFLNGGILNKLLKFIYDLAKEELSLDFIELRTDKHDLLYFEFKD